MKRTPEQEAYRISRIRATLKGKPATEKQRHARAEGLRQAHSEGRIKINRTPEAIEKGASKLRGRKRPIEVVEKIRNRISGIKRTPEQIEALRRRMINGWAAGKYRPSPEGKERQRLGTIAANKGRVHSLEHRRKHADAIRGKAQNPEVIEHRASLMRGRPQVAEATKMGPTNQRAIEGALRDPAGRIWWFKNLTHFVRENAELFNQSDLLWNRRSGNCNASKRLLALFGRGKKVPGSWKGWTVATSIIEQRDGYADLIDRDLSSIIR